MLDLNEIGLEFKKKIALCLGCNQNRGRRSFEFLIFFLNGHMPRLDQNRGSKVHFLLRSKQTRGRKYIKFFYFLNFWYALGLGWAETEAVNILYASGCNRGINYWLFTSVVYAAVADPKPKAENNRCHFPSLH